MYPGNCCKLIMEYYQHEVIQNPELNNDDNDAIMIKHEHDDRIDVIEQVDDECVCECERFTSIFPKNWRYDGGPATRS